MRNSWKFLTKPKTHDSMVKYKNKPRPIRKNK